MNYLMDLRKIIGSRPVIACGAGVGIVNLENEILLQRRADNDCWGLVGGMMELGETIEETAKREVFEEVGMVLGDITFFKVYSGQEFYYKYPNGDEVFNVINIFTVKGDFKEVDIEMDQTEVKDVRFFSFDEIPENISPPDVEIIKDLVAHYKNNFVSQ